MAAADRRILQLLQQDATLSIAEIAARIGLSATPCWKRIQRLEASGIIRRRVALLDPHKLGLAVTAIVSVELANHSSQAIADFANGRGRHRGVMECYRMAGDIDYVIRVAVPDMPAFDEVWQTPHCCCTLKNATWRFALSRSSQTELPLGR
jgi:Lrp/AsnC family transcriptional regulator